MNKGRVWLVALAAALALAAGAMIALNREPEPARTEAGGRGSAFGTSGALLVLIIVLAASARRRRRKEGDRDDG